MTAPDHEQQAAPSRQSSRGPGGLGVRERAVTAARPKVKWAGLLVGCAVGVPLILREPDRQFALIVLVVLIVVMAGVVALALARRPEPQCCTLYARGLTVQTGSGPIVTTRWDEIRTVERGIAVHRGNGTVAKRELGLTIGLDTDVIELPARFPDSERLFARIDQQFSERRLQRAVADLAGGGEVSFTSSWERESELAGIASISAAGLRVQDDVFDWDEIRGVVVDRGEVTIGVRGGRDVTLPAYGFPNLTVFVALIKQLAGGQGH